MKFITIVKDPLIILDLAHNASESVREPLVAEIITTNFIAINYHDEVRFGM